jgi:diacylglycerol kinase family enzyme
VINTNLIVAGNGRFAGGGMMLAPNAQLDDGLLDVIVTDGAGRLDVIRELPRVHRGGLLKNPKVSEERTERLAISGPDSLPIELDGELVGRTPAEIQVIRSSIRFAAPRTQ